ncbi:MAG: oligopeptide ABC transporter ATP-binding protein OppF, partial [Lachnospiraceae bacterium]|nr:oligopeptide ABC transporter ATP-binding protein OppF [Lachnospiraceae bacterium]MCR4956941.1 oligopeptide ABC transporter ATP-binding protein OppF [Lachnospiraceae bacterium]
TNTRIPIKGEIPSPINPKNACRFAGRCQYATERCFNEMPQLREIKPGHKVACHLMEEKA